MRLLGGQTRKTSGIRRNSENSVILGHISK